MGKMSLLFTSSKGSTLVSDKLRWRPTSHFFNPKEGEMPFHRMKGSNFKRRTHTEANSTFRSCCFFAAFRGQRRFFFGPWVSEALQAGDSQGHKGWEPFYFATRVSGQEADSWGIFQLWWLAMSHGWVMGGSSWFFWTSTVTFGQIPHIFCIFSTRISHSNDQWNRGFPSHVWLQPIDAWDPWWHLDFWVSERESKGSPAKEASNKSRFHGVIIFRFPEF